MFYPKSLQQRTILFILLPIFLFLSGAGLVGYRAVRKVLLDQWGETALANLERAAHHIDMQLNSPKQIISLLEGLSEQDSTSNLHEFIIDRLNRIDGVVSVTVDWPEHGVKRGIEQPTPHMNASAHRHEKSRKGALEITTPVYNVAHNSKTVSMLTDLVDNDGYKIGQIEVTLDFEFLISQTVQAPWWNVDKAYIVDLNGNILVGTITAGNTLPGQNRESFTTPGTLEQKTLNAMRDKEFGTVFGPGTPAHEISGFYRLKEAPWTMIVITPGKKVLQPIIHFRSVYFLAAIACIGVILLFIRVMLSHTTEAIRKVSQTATNLARGVFSAPLEVTTTDEVGDLTRNFNTMTSQLQKGVQLQKAMNIAREVQLTLLPQNDYSEEGLLASGLSVYCDETGGDYFDFIQSDLHPGKLHVVVGDVVGHGIGAALLMATLRALVRAKVDQPGIPEEMISGVNQQLYRDTAQFGNFASLFYLCIDRAGQELQWVRAGHDPAILYFPESGEFIEIKGKGLVLGLDASYQYQTNTRALAKEPVVLLIGSDGVWETENEKREQFGKQRVRDIMAANYHLPPKALLRCIIESIEQFRGSTPLQDDITLVGIALNSGIST
ncbi:MAG: SpoIIE family protein phosphatase [Proteobacteria bacterium]|nr:SpoIIE family protein phosphatase [Pseudomonadota bacterium]MBU1056701.1 SpoIIE family protein phosphatase [Pseudomonadota bacterium]